MSAEETRNNKKPLNKNKKDHNSRKERPAKNVNADRKHYNRYDEEKIDKSDQSQPMGEFSDWNRQRS